MKTLLPNCASEMLGTFMLVFAGTGAIIFNDISQGSITHLGIAAVFGLIVLTVIYAYGDISGAHINPAVTIGCWVAKRFPAALVIPYIISQCLGAIAASALLLALIPDHANYGATIASVGTWQAFILELLLSWWLMTVILRVSHGSKEKGLVAGIVVGATVGLEALFAGPLTGASMNPARSLAPALASGQVSELWLYLTAPILGMLLATISCKLVSNENCC